MAARRKSTTSRKSDILRSPRRESRDDQRNRVLDACALVFAKKGFGGSTIGDIVQLAGVSRPIFYKHFAGKTEAVEAVVETMVRSWPTGESALGESNAASLRIHISNTVAFALENPLMQILFQEEFPALITQHVERFMTAGDEALQWIEATFRAGQAQGEFDLQLDPALTAQTLQTVQYGLCKRALGIHLSEPELRREHVDHTVSILLRGLAPRNPATRNPS